MPRPLPEERTISGKLAIMAIGLVAVAAVVGAWLYHAGVQRRALAFWEPANARLLVRARQVDAERLAPSGEADRSGARMVATAAGFVHLRSALIHDASFDWSASPPTPPPGWRWRLSFADEGQTAVVRFSDDCRWVESSTGQVGRLIDPIAKEAHVLLEREFSGGQQATPAD